MANLQNEFWQRILRAYDELIGEDVRDPAEPADASAEVLQAWVTRLEGIYGPERVYNFKTAVEQYIAYRTHVPAQPKAV